MDFYIGQIIPIAIGYAPKQTAMCQGQSLPINQNGALFTLLGTAFGGNGSTSFNLPNVAGRTLVGQNITGGQLMGAIGGEANHTLVNAEIPPHSHTMGAITGSVGGQDASGAVPSAADSAVYGPATNLVGLGGAPLSTLSGGQPHNNMQPSTPINFTIVLYGIFPSRA